MNPDQITGAMWDNLIEHAVKTPTTTAPRNGLAVLKMLPQPKRTEKPEVSRSVAGINPKLRQTIRQVITGNAPWPLVLWGPVGTGKTCTALCLLDCAGGFFHTVAGLCSLLIQSQQGRLQWEHEGRGGQLWPETFWKRLAAAPLIALDELGCRGTVTDAHYEVVKTAIEERHGRPLVVASNLSPAEIASNYDARIASRLAAGTVIELQGKDQRVSP